MMRLLLRAHDATVTLLAQAAAAVIVVVVAILYDVTLRNLGFQPPLWTLPLVEFGLLYCVMLMAPWLVRANGHIIIRSFTNALHATVRRILDRIVCAVCIVILGFLSWYALLLTVESFQRGDTYVAAISIPMPLMVGPAVVSYLLMLIEFARYLWTGTSLLDESKDAQDGF